MQIYPEEKHLEELILANRTTAMIGSFKIVEDKTDILLKSLKTLNNVDKAFAKILSQVAEHPDLMYGSAILVSTALNRNDDFFLPKETWEARSTAINTPYNNQHEEKNIIGHIIDTRVLDKDGNIIENDKDVPDFFDIEADFVLYKDIYPELAKGIAEGAADGTKFVSMEAKLTAFDYGLIDPQYEMDIVARNNKTAFLTKYLRTYGGTGEFNGKKIVRVLRKFRFTGMGNVDDPANLRSEYTKINNLDGIEDYTKAYFYITKGNIMKIENLDQAMKKIEELEAHIQKNESESVKAQIDKLAAEKTDLTNTINSEKSKVEVAEQQIATLKKDLETTKADLTKANTNLEAKTAELDKITNESRLTARISKLTELGVVIAEDKKAKYASMTDEAFAELIDFAQSIGKTKDDKEKKDEEEDKKDKKGKSKAELEQEKKDKEAKAAEEAAKAALEKAKADANGADVTTGSQENQQLEIKAVAEKLAAAVVKKRKNADIKK